MIFKEQQQNLLKWFKKNARLAPWRNKPAGFRDPYFTWVSEVMLQQTQFSTVIPYFENWTRRFPTLRSLAEAGENDVLQLWKGLGYYRRARFLHKGSQALMNKYKGEFPATALEIKEIPGIGEYTCGAILSLSFNLPQPILDGNLIRIFSRTNLLPKYPENKKEEIPYWEISKQWVEHDTPGLVNEALMELGALVCTKNQPKCFACPLAKVCQANLLNKTSEYPPVKKRASSVMLTGCAWLIHQGDAYYLVRSDHKGLLKNHWMFPLEFVDQEGLSSLRVPKNLKKQLLGSIRHSIMHYKIHLEVFSIDTEQLPKAKFLQSLKNQINTGWGMENCKFVNKHQIPKKITNKLGQKIWNLILKIKS